MTTYKMFHTKAIKNYFGARFAIIDNKFCANDGKVEVMTMNVHGSPDGRFFHNDGHEIDADTIVMMADMVAMRTVKKPVDVVTVACCHPKACKAATTHPMIQFPGEWEGTTGVQEYHDGSRHVVVAPYEYFTSGK